MKSFNPYLYLTLNQHNIFYFRRTVPLEIRPYINKREIKKSLGTHDPKIALRLAAHYSVYVDTIFEQARSKQMVKKANASEFIVRKTITNQNGESETREVEVDPDNIDSELIALKKAGLVNDANELVDFAEKLGIPLDENNTRNTTDNSNTANSSTNLLLSVLIDEYCNDCIDQGSWSDSTNKSNRQSLNTLLFLIGDKTVSSIDRTTAREVREKLKKYPKNKNKIEKYKALSIDQLLDIEINDAISDRTINKNLTIFSSLFRWAESEGIITKNPFEKISVKDNVHASQKRERFEHQDLIKIFSSSLYTAHDYNQIFKYWVPLIALFTGTRLAEIAQLEIDDIKNSDDFYILDINTSSQDEVTAKRTKNFQSIRKIPIHPELIRLGLIRYKDELVKKGETRLFPELTLDSRGVYSRKISDWFNPVYLKSVNVNSDKKKFHCFRGTLSSELRDNGVDLHIIRQIIGHETGSSVIEDHYLAPLKPKQLYDCIKKLNFDKVVKDIKPYYS